MSVSSEAKEVVVCKQTINCNSQAMKIFVVLVT